MKLGFLRALGADIVHVARREKKLWLVPLIIILMLVAGLLAIGPLFGPLAPFIYPLF